MPGKPDNDNLQRIVSKHGDKLGALEKSTRELLEETGDIKASVAGLTAKLPNGWKAPPVIVAVVSVIVAVLSLSATLVTLWYNTTKVDKLAGLINGKDGIKDSLALQADRDGRLVTRIRDQTGLALWQNEDREASIHAFRGRPAYPRKLLINPAFQAANWLIHRFTNDPYEMNEGTGARERFFTRGEGTAELYCLSVSDHI